MVPDLARYPELEALDRFDAAVPMLLALALFGAGEALGRFAPGLETDGLQLLVWGFAVSTVAVWHAIFAINSLAHTMGRRPHATRDDMLEVLPRVLTESASLLIVNGVLVVADEEAPQQLAAAIPWVLVKLTPKPEIGRAHV